MNQSFEDAGKAGKEYMDAGLTSLATMTKSLQAIAGEAADYTKKSFENGSVALENLFAAKSPEKAFEVQMEYGKQAYEGFVAEATRIGDLFADLGKEALRPLESAFARSR